MKLVKDLLFSKGNKYLDVARFSAFFSVCLFWGGVYWSLYLNKDSFDPTAVGIGCASIFAGAAGWIYYREKKENGDLE